ncbi:MAG TPA: ATP-binding protein [Acidimicrobiales bacterium]|nr:ATP-binding protein [Acidimicrobiales bacterium]
MAASEGRDPGRRFGGVLVIGLCAGWMVASFVIFRFLADPRSHNAAFEVAVGWTLIAVTGMGVLAVVHSLIAGAEQARIARRALEHRLHAVNLVTETSLAVMPLDEFLRTLLKRVSDALGVRSAAVVLLNEDRSEASVTASVNAELDGSVLTLESAGFLDDLFAKGRAGAIGPIDALGGVFGDASRVDGAPVCVDGGPAGAILVSGGDEHADPDERLMLLDLAADRASAALERARLDDAQRRARLGANSAREHLSLLAQVGEVLAEAMDDYKSATEQVGRLIVPAFADWFAADFTDDSGGVVVRVREGTAKGPYRRRYRAWDELIQPSVNEGHPQLFFVRDGHQDAGTELLESAGFQSLMIVPVRVRGLSFGALRFATRPRRRGYRPGDLATAQAIAHRVASTIERVLLYRETREAARTATDRASSLRRLMEAALSVNELLSEDQAVAVVADQARRVASVERAVVLVRSDDGAALRTESTAEESPLGEEEAGRLEALCIAAEESNRSQRSAGGEDGPDAWAWLAAPMRYQGSSLGSIALMRRTGDFSPEDELMAVSFTQVAAAAIGNARLYQDVLTNGQRLEALMQSAPLAIVEADLAGHARWFNSAARSILGRIGIDLVSTSFLEAMPTFPEPIRAAWNEAVAGRPTSGLEISVPGADGREIHLLVSVAPMRGPDGDTDGVLAIVDDVTRRVRMEEQALQAERLDAMGRLAGGVAHDFNNLLTVIFGYSDLARRQADDEDAVRSHVGAIQRAAERAAALTGQLLAVGRRETGNPAVVDPVGVIRTMESVLVSVTGDDVTARFDLTPCEAVVIDPSQLERVVLNLVMNAVDAMPHGGVLTVATRQGGIPADGPEAAAQEGPVVEISVSDTGIGMDAATAEHCFEPFFTTKDPSKGTGLGLAAVHGIITQASGDIVVETAPGRGTTFTLRLPAVAAAPARPEGPTRHVRRGTGTVLLVEDEEELRALAVEHLEACGYEVLSAAGARQALELAKGREGGIDLLVTDVVMPGTSGIELAHQLGDVLGDLPVLFVSGYAGSDKLPTDRLPADADLLPKPFSPEELSHRVAEALEASNGRQSRPGGA